MVCYIKNFSLEGKLIVMDKYQEQILTEIKCSTCLDHRSKIYQCLHGHIMCESCLRHCKVSVGGLKCSICRVATGWSRNRSLENVCEIINLTVDCGIPNCNHVDKLRNIDLHRSRCIHRCVNCPVADECDEVKIVDLIQHLELHPREVVKYTPKMFLNFRAFSCEKGFRKTIIMQENVIVIEALFHSSHQFIDVYGKVLTNKPVRVNLCNFNPIKKTQQSCICDIMNDDLVLIMRTKIYSEMYVHQELKSVTWHMTSDCTSFHHKDLSFQSLENAAIAAEDENFVVFLSFLFEA